MTDSTATKADESSEITPDEIEFSIDEIPDDRVAEITESVRVESPSGELPLGDVMVNLALAHKDLHDTKKASLSLYQALDERKHEAEADGNAEVAEVLENVKKTAFGVYLRLQRGDLELLGERDGTYCGYFNEDFDHTEVEPDAPA